MFFSKIKRYFEKTLSEGQGMQLIWLLLIIACILLLFWGVVAFVFRDGSMEWQDLLALFLDPGGFGGAGSHDLFRLLATLCGMFLFSALLISVVSNMFENIADSFRNGFSRYRHKDHILILGGGNQLVSMLDALLEEGNRYRDSQIVVLTTQKVVKLRASIFSFFDGAKGRELDKRLTFNFGERDNENNLAEKNLARNAKAIYIIGEDGELDHDSLSVRCCNKLKTLCTGADHDIPCFLVLQDPASVDVYKYVTDAETKKGSRLKVDVVDANEYIAEQVLVADHDGRDIIEFPPIDYNSITRREDGSFNVEAGITSDCRKYVHFVVIGTGRMARSMALTAAHICHFPNYNEGEFRTRITFVDVDMKKKMNTFVSSFDNLFCLSNFKYVSFSQDGSVNETIYKPYSQYGDFLDIEWQFIDADICSADMRRMLRKWVNDPEQALSLAFCQDTQEQNTFSALHLPGEIYGKGCPIFVYQQKYGDILRQAKNTRLFGNIHIFGMSSDIQDDPLFIYRSRNGQEVNFIYNKEYGNPKYSTPEEAWFTIPEAHKFSSIYCANALRIRAHSFQLEGTDFGSIDPSLKTLLYETEHRRWMMSSLILGYRALDSATRADWKRRRQDKDPDIKQVAKDQYKKLKKEFRHMDITPFSDLIPEEQEKDRIILENYSVIMKKKGE